MLYRISSGWARIELGLAAFLAVCITLLVLLNVVTRTMGNALFWVDELAIYAMAWMTFLGASAALHHRTSVSVTLVPDVVSPKVKVVILKVVDVIVFAFAAAMLYFCWRWFMPLEFACAGFDAKTFQGNTFNFIYAEPTSTLGLPKYMFWTIMWVFAFGATLHSTMHLLRPVQPDSAP
ncbi:MAG: TRAP transporter small permease subunit [Litoreibacter sp.]